MRNRHLAGPPMLLAIDDTDAPSGGCTTRVVLDVLSALPTGVVPRGLPRLVRLNPNVPWKTRGNGAVCLPLGTPDGARAQVGEWRGMQVLAFPEGDPVAPDADLFARVTAAVRLAAQPGAAPGVALFPHAPSPFGYWAAVRTVVEPGEARKACLAEGARFEAEGDGRALVGCLAAAAWPGPPTSYEFLAYREPARCGEARSIDPGPLLPLDAEGVTFHTHDPKAGRLACVPSTPDPVLCGLRGHDPDLLRDAAVRTLLQAAGEPVDAWLLFATNQASGDHVTPAGPLAEAPAYATVEARARVTSPPRRGAGGHVFVPMEDAAGAPFVAAAFEPTKGFRDAVAALRPGDAVRVVGALRGEAGRWTLHLEKLYVESLGEAWEQGPNPTCPSCGKRMKSRGAGAGYRCGTCRTRAPADAVGKAILPRRLRPGAYEVPVLARRHLHRPEAWTSPP